MDIQAEHLLTERWVDASSLPTTSRQQAIIGLTAFLTALCVFMFILRVVSRSISEKMGIDDYLMGCATVFAVANMAANYIFWKYDFTGFPATSSERLSGQDIEAANFWSFITQILYNPVLSLVKSSMLVLLLRIGGHRTEARWTIHVCNTLNLLLTIAIILAVIFQSVPVQASWDADVKATRQIDFGAFAVWTGTITLVGDIVVLGIPLWLFVGLQMRLVTKLGLIGVFLLGGIVTLVSIARLVVFHIAFTAPETFDYTYSWAPALGQIESSLAIITGCVPTLRPVAASLMPSLFTTRNGSNNHYGPEIFIASRTFGGSSVVRPAGHSSVVPNSFVLQNLGRTRTIIRSESPDGSEEEMMVSDGIVLKRQVEVSYDLETLSANRSNDEAYRP